MVHNVLEARGSLTIDCGSLSRSVNMPWQQNYLFATYLNFTPGDIGSSPNVKDYGFMGTQASEGRIMKYPVCAICLRLLLNLNFQGKGPSLPTYK